MNLNKQLFTKDRLHKFTEHVGSWNSSLLVLNILLRGMKADSSLPAFNVYNLKYL